MNLPTSRLLCLYALTITRTRRVQFSEAFSQTVGTYHKSQSRSHTSSNQIKIQDEDTVTTKNGSFLEEVFSWLRSSNITFHEKPIQQSPFPIIGLGRDPSDGNDSNEGRDSGCKSGVCLHIIPTPTSTTNKISPNLCKMLTDNNKNNDNDNGDGDDNASLPYETIIHLHQDVWNNKKDIVQARISAKVNRVQSSYARKTTMKRIDKRTAMEFLEKHHLWGATKAKFNYGLFEKQGNELIAVATFSPRRHVQRGIHCVETPRGEGGGAYAGALIETDKDAVTGIDAGTGTDAGTNTNTDIDTAPPRPYRSHELIRYCSKRDGRVVGGITKLIAGFCRDFAPDDLVTCIDRDWGDGGGWESIQFEKVSVMPPLVMAVGGDGVRRYLVGAGIGQPNVKGSTSTSNSNSNSNEAERSDKNARNGRPGISFELYNTLDQIEDHKEAIECLNSHDLSPVYDAGVERRMLLISNSKLKAQTKLRREELGLEAITLADHVTVNDLWTSSVPSFPSDYYSKNKGINSLLQHARESVE